MRTYLVSVVSLLVLSACEQSADFGRPAKPTETAPVAQPTAAAAAASKPTPVPASTSVSPAPSGRRANGEGFTIALADKWEAEPVDASNVFRARLDGGGNLEIMKLPQRDQEVPRSEHLCRTWGETRAKSLGGTTSGSQLANGSCVVRIAARGMGFYLQAFERSSTMYAAICVGVVSSDSVENACASMVASWHDDASAKPNRHQARVVISRELDHPVARTASFTTTFPKDWRVTEGTSDMLLQGMNDDGGMVAISLVDDLGVTTIAECESFAKPIADMFKATSRGARVIRTDGGLGCRLSMSGGVFSWTHFLTASDGKSYMFACGALKGDAPEEACEQIFASWTFKRGA